MLSFEFFDAKHGDAFLTRWGNGASRVMLVDGGPTGVYEAGLKVALTRLLPRDQNGIPHLDVVYLSHIDDDHVAGLVRLFADIRRARNDQLAEPFSVGLLWFNSVEELVDKAEPGLAASVQPLFERAQTSDVMKASYNQGRALRNAAVFLRLDGNSPFNGQLVQGDSTSLDGLEVTVVCPDDQALAKLADRWRKAKQEKNPEVITAAYDDQSIPNLSSIVLHVKHGQKTALLTGDARGDRILAGLRASNLLDGDGPLRVDLMKVPHHGSERNMKPDFFEKIHAIHYVVSADGIKHHHPHEDTLTALVESRAPTDEFTVHLTNDIPFAVQKLKDLQVGRSFEISVRAVEEQALLIAIG